MSLIASDCLQLDFQERGKVINTKKFPIDTHVNSNLIQGRYSTEDQKIPADIMVQGRFLVCTHASSCLWFLFILCN